MLISLLRKIQGVRDGNKTPLAGDNGTNVPVQALRQ